MHNPGSYDAFISYARNDGQKYAEQLEHDLLSAGLNTWRDKRDLNPDQDFTAELEYGMECSKHVVCCVTPDTRRRNSFVRREIGYALALRKPVIPLIFEDTNPPIHIINITREDFTHVPWKEASKALLARLRRGQKPDEQGITPPADPYRSYLNALYRQIVDFLKQSVFSEIALRSVPTDQAVNVPANIALPLAFSRGVVNDFAKGELEPSMFANFGEAFSEYDGRALILGAAGAGKTTTLLAFARDRVAERLHDPNQPLPLLASIRTWNSNIQTPLDEWLAQEIPMLNQNDIGSLLDSHSAMLLLDGIDELGSQRVEKGDTFDPRKRFLAITPLEDSVVLTCRAKEYIEIGEKITLNGAVTLSPFSDEQLEQYLIDMPALWQALQADEDLRNIVRTPLLLGILTKAYLQYPSELDTLRDLKATPVELRQRIFRTFVKARFEHEKRHLHSKLPYSIDEMHEELGWAAVENEDFPGPISTEQGQSISTSFQKRLGASAETFIEQGLRLHLLIRDRNGGIDFPHLLLRDYFGFRYAMEYIQNPSENESWYHLNRALTLLAKSGDDKVLELLLEHCQPVIDFPLVHLLDPFVDPRVFLAYARSLGSVRGLPQYDVVADIAHPKFRYLVGQFGRSNSARMLATAAAGAPPKERVWYLYALGEARLSEELDTLIKYTRDEDDTVRGYAAFALGMIGVPEAVESLERLLVDKTEIVLSTPWGNRTTVSEIAVDSLNKIELDQKKK